MAGWSKRQRTTAWSVVLTVGGTLLLGGAAVLVERSRDTDLGDGLRDVHSKFLGTGDAAFGTLRFTEVAREWALEFHHAPYRARAACGGHGLGCGARRPGRGR
jgi:hypothetical protein